MDLDSASSNTSVDDKTEDYGDNPTRDALVEGLMCLLKPTIDQIDIRVQATRTSQTQLSKQIDLVSDELKTISEEQHCPVQLDKYVQKLQNSKKKITVISNVLQNVQERLNRLHQLAEKEVTEQEATLFEAPTDCVTAEEPSSSS